MYNSYFNYRYIFQFALYINKNNTFADALRMPYNITISQSQLLYGYVNIDVLVIMISSYQPMLSSTITVIM